ncbi:unnamed protein product [Adineta ricciae]|uniref:G-protein coupled receptors family 1 profile domain-containing protein n=1 Tax=Adineta ricciae TaxID=249248 RepID=A0A814JRV9_ADIRI|nr:unnamed protein product [Adineta ricciae]CAF1458982.1 unnamed protein product [Adineta ricciae]
MHNSSITASSYWFIPVDIVMLICLSLLIILNSLLLLVLIFDKTCHKLPVILVSNTYLAQILLAAVIFSMATFALQNDLKNIVYLDRFCLFRGYLSYVLCTIMNFSFLLQAFYRYLSAVYPTYTYWKSKKLHLLLVSLTWVYSFLYPLPFTLSGEITYNVDNQVCQIPLRLSFALIYAIFNVYLLPVGLIQLIYFKLVRHIKDLNAHPIGVHNTFRVQRELRMVRQIVIIVCVLIIFGLPYSSFALTSFFTTPPKYHFRIAVLFIISSLVFITLALFYFTSPIKSSVNRLIGSHSSQSYEIPK